LSARLHDLHQSLLELQGQGPISSLKHTLTSKLRTRYSSTKNHFRHQYTQDRTFCVLPCCLCPQSAKDRRFYSKARIRISCRCFVQKGFRFFPVWEYLDEVKDTVEEDLDEELWEAKDLKIPVYNTEDGTPLSLLI
jgi:hypothetical protein